MNVPKSLLLLTLVIISTIDSFSQLFFDQEYSFTINGNSEVFSGYELIRLSDEQSFLVTGGTSAGKQVTVFTELNGVGDATGNSFTVDIAYLEIGRNSVLYQDNHFFLAGTYQTIESNPVVLAKIDINGTIVKTIGLPCEDLPEAITTGDQHMENPSQACLNNVIDMTWTSDGEIKILAQENFDLVTNQSGDDDVVVVEFDTDLNLTTIIDVYVAHAEPKPVHGIVENKSGIYGISAKSILLASGALTTYASVFDYPSSINNKFYLEDAVIYDISNQNQLAFWLNLNSNPRKLFVADNYNASLNQLSGTLFLNADIVDFKFLDENQAIVLEEQVQSQGNYQYKILVANLIDLSTQTIIKSIVVNDPASSTEEFIVDKISYSDNNHFDLILRSEQTDKIRLISFSADLVNPCFIECTTSLSFQSHIEDVTNQSFQLESRPTEFPALSQRVSETTSFQNCCTYTLPTNSSNVTICCNGTEFNWNISLINPPMVGSTYYYSGENNDSPSPFGQGGPTSMSFNISEAGVYTFYYQDENGCYGQATIDVECYPEPELECPNSCNFCIDDCLTEAFVLPSYGYSGTWSGIGVSGNQGNQSFNPLSSCVGSNQLSYNYVDENSCTRESEFNVLVDDCHEGYLDQSYCNQSPLPIQLPFESCEFYQGSGIVNNSQFYPPNTGSNIVQRCRMFANCTLCLNTTIYYGSTYCKSNDQFRETDTYEYYKFELLSLEGRLLCSREVSESSQHEILNLIASETRLTSGVYLLNCYSKTSEERKTFKVFLSR